VPIYEFRCENGHLFEVMQKITDAPVTECEADKKSSDSKPAAESKPASKSSDA
jgi:putative FmdB family regulatory protein